MSIRVYVDFCVLEKGSFPLFPELTPNEKKTIKVESKILHFKC